MRVDLPITHGEAIVAKRWRFLDVGEVAYPILIFYVSGEQFFDLHLYIFRILRVALVYGLLEALLVVSVLLVLL